MKKMIKSNLSPNPEKDETKIFERENFNFSAQILETKNLDQLKKQCFSLHQENIEMKKNINEINKQHEIEIQNFIEIILIQKKEYEFLNSIINNLRNPEKSSLDYQSALPEIKENTMIKLNKFSDYFQEKKIDQNESLDINNNQDLLKVKTSEESIYEDDKVFKKWLNNQDKLELDFNEIKIVFQKEQFQKKQLLSNNKNQKI